MTYCWLTVNCQHDKSQVLSAWKQLMNRKIYAVVKELTETSLLTLFSPICGCGALGIRLSGRLGSVRLTVGLHALKSCFQSKWFCDLSVQCLYNNISEISHRWALANLAKVISGFFVSAAQVSTLVNATVAAKSARGNTHCTSTMALTV